MNTKVKIILFVLCAALATPLLARGGRGGGGRLHRGGGGSHGGGFHRGDGRSGMRHRAGGVKHRGGKRYVSKKGVKHKDGKVKDRPRPHHMHNHPINKHGGYWVDNQYYSGVVVDPYNAYYDPSLCPRWPAGLCGIGATTAIATTAAAASDNGYDDDYDNDDDNNGK